jgi:hypothetical protein
MSDDKRPTARSIPGPVSERSIFERLSLKSIAGGAAVFLGAVYAYGAVIKAGELHAAGQSVGDTLPLVPLEQILVLGIDRLLPVGIAILVTVLVGMGFVNRLRRPATDRDADTESTDDSARESNAEKRGRLIFRAVLGGIFIVLLFTAEWTIWLLMAEIWAVGLYAEAEHSTLRTYMIFTTIALIVYFSAVAWFDPSPLPHVRLTTRQDRVIAGDLIAATGSAWYIGVADKQWTAVQTREIEQVRASAVKKKRKQSIYHAITGHRLFNLGPE